MGKAKAAKAAAMQDSSLSTTNPPKQTASTLGTSAKDNTKQADVLAQLMKRIEEQDKELKALKASF